MARQNDGASLTERGPVFQCSFERSGAGLLLRSLCGRLCHAPARDPPLARRSAVCDDDWDARQVRRRAAMAIEAISKRRESVATLRFYAELCDFLAPSPEDVERTYRFRDNPSVKAAIEGCGVPHTEVDLILVNGDPVDFRHPLADGDRVSVYPVFETLDIGALTRLRERPLRDVRFVLDANLGKLARWLRLLGFDAEYRNDFGDAEIVDESVRDRRVLLTRDRRLLQHKRLTHGYWVRSDMPDVQVIEVLRRFQIERALRPFSRCLDCNGTIAPVPKAEVAARLQPKTRLYYDEFHRCARCGKIYWRGTHYDRLLARLRRVVGAGNDPARGGSDTA